MAVDDLLSEWAKRPAKFRVMIMFSVMTLMMLRQQMTITSGFSSKAKAAMVHLESSAKSSSSPPIKTYPCPPLDPAVEEKFVGFPQKLTLGKYINETGAPFVTQDFWFNAVDNRRTFFLRPTERRHPSAEKLRDWIQSRPHPISLVINNQQDLSWPPHLSGDRKFEIFLNLSNLHAVYAGNARYLPEYAHKIIPIPIGLKWAYYSPRLFGERKDNRTANFKRYGASSPEQSRELFESSQRTTTVYWRPMMLKSNRGTNNYRRDTPALKAIRYEIPAIVKETAKRSMVFSPKKYTTQEIFFNELKKHRFVISPPGNGLDTHATWEALMCGCIPIVPRSDLDPVFEDLPVWLVDSWEEVTDASVKEKEAYFRGKQYRWEKLYQPYWAERIYEGLCTL